MFHVVMITYPLRNREIWSQDFKTEAEAQREANHLSCNATSGKVSFVVEKA